jgi:CRISPR-associated endonuclease/helicase Cas3
MSELRPEQFAEFFEKLNDRPPFPWQERLAEQVCDGAWPEVIDLPTASGKTACLDIALFQLAVTGTSPRRLFFVVDRRVIVNEAFQRMGIAAEKLSNAKDGILASVANSLRELAGGPDACPLTVYQLRGGVYRDQSWMRSPLQPMVVTSTVDQVGSRLLFRGYGVSDSSAPIHAALIANDSLIFLDEAHCSRAFSQTLSAVRAYRGDAWARSPLSKPFYFVEMTATPAQQAVQPFRLDDRDRKNSLLSLRLITAKPTTLHLVKAGAKDSETLPLTLARQATGVATESGAKRIAVMVNRVATARRVFELLSGQIPAENLHLLIGRMRPIDRDMLVERLNPLKAGASRNADSPPTFVVSTQCLEVGADLDFDLLINECASIDALLQRFGRLDRLGDLKGKARGCIVTTTVTLESKDADPIYGHTIAATWHWLNQLSQASEPLNMGIESPDRSKPSVAQALRALPKEEAAKLRRVGAEAPALLPAHLDALVQTSPKPAADPDVALFLHGRDEGPAEIQVVWRKDLDEVEVGEWKRIVALCPPVSAEAMPVRLAQFRQWLAGGNPAPIPDSDLEGAGEDPEVEGDEDKELQPFLIWRGEESPVVGRANDSKPKDIKPNDTIVLSLSQQGWERFGHMPEPAADVAEQAIRQARGRTVFRVHKKLWPIAGQLDELLKNEEFDWKIWSDLLDGNPEFLEFHGVASANDRLFKSPLPYPAKEGEPPAGWLLQRIEKNKPTQVCRAPLPFDEDAGNDETSNTNRRITLEQHTKDVKTAVQAFTSKLLPSFVETFDRAAHLHDAGKVDPRFQALLHGGDHLAAAFSPKPLAKGEALTSGFYKSIRMKSDLHEHFRHELVSLHFAAKVCQGQPGRDLILHLIASHHGYCRPFAPVVPDANPPEVVWEGTQISAEERLASPAHELSNGIQRRFWRINRDFGWWGSAYLEACLRLADWAASAIRTEKENI